MKPQTRLTAFVIASCWLIGLIGTMLTDGWWNTGFLLVSVIPLAAPAFFYALHCAAQRDFS
jgi:hypothetical protein